MFQKWRDKYRSFRNRETRFSLDITRALESNISSRNFPNLSDSEISRLQSKWGRFLARVASLPGVGSSGGNSVEILEAGDKTVKSMIEAIDGAKDRVWLETYIFDDSEIVARRVVDSLIRAKQRGCDVVVIMDYIGSTAFKWRRDLENENIPVVLFNPFPWSHLLDASVPKSVGPIPFRDHRKILIADKVGFCGSMNIQGDTVVREGEMHPLFYDLTAKIVGPSVLHLANVFIDSLDESGTGITRTCQKVEFEQTFPDDVYIQVLQSNVRKQRRSIQRALARQIKEAESEVLVASSYFMPPGFLKRALLAPSRKVACNILVSGTTDFFPVPGDLLAQTHALSRFVKKDDNTRVHLYSLSHMHAKFTAVDKLFVQLGSYNFDRFSSRRNLEVAVGIFDHRVTSQVAQIHHRLESESNLATDDGIYFRNPLARFICWMAYTVMKHSGRNLFDGFDAYANQKSVVRKKEWTLFFGRPEIIASSLKF
jgi:cardiolipin synthase